MILTVGSLFSGIGGLDLGLERAGMVIKWQVENNEYCQRVLAKHWPNMKRYGDVRDCGADNLERVDLICGGFPCQPVSCAGKRQGVADQRWLWPEFARIIRELGPQVVLAENVPGLLSIDAGRVFGTVLRDLAACGYDAEWGCIPAAAVGAPHIRYRVFILARWIGSPSELRSGCALANPGRNGFGQFQQPTSAIANSSNTRTRSETMADTDCRGQQEFAEFDGEAELNSANRYPQRRHANGCSDDVSNDDGKGCADIQGQCATSEAHGSAFAGANRREPEGIWSPEPNVGRVADGVPRRVDRLRCLGNAVVPQVAEWIGRRIVDSEKEKTR